MYIHTSADITRYFKTFFSLQGSALLHFSDFGTQGNSDIQGNCDIT